MSAKRKRKQPVKNTTVEEDGVMKSFLIVKNSEPPLGCCSLADQRVTVRWEAALGLKLAIKLIAKR